MARRRKTNKGQDRYLTSGDGRKDCWSDVRKEHGRTTRNIWR